MTLRLRGRGLAVPLVVLVLLVGAAFGTAVSSAHPAHSGHAAALTTRGLAFHDQMRKLWEDHITWTRLAIVSFAGGLPDLQATEARLLKNQTDIGNAVKPYYGDAAAGKLTDLLKQHIAIAGELVAAAKAGDAAKKTDADKRWHDNAADIAAFLASANPNWTKAALVTMLNRHLALTTQEAVDRLQKNWTDDQVTFDSILTQAMEMADALSDGILKQFPAKA